MAHDRNDEQGKRSKRDSDLDLSVGQVLAATGASTFGAVLAKVLNLWGTVAGTALLSICASIGTVLILRAIRRTGDRIKDQLISVQANRPAGSPAVETAADGTARFTATATIPLPRDGDRTLILNTANGVGDRTRVVDRPGEPAHDRDEDTAAHPASARRARRKTLTAIAVSSVIVFALTIGTLYLIGSLTGEPGRFIDNTPAQQGTVSEAPADSPLEADEPGEDASLEPTEPSAPTAPSETEPAPTNTPAPPPTEAPTSDPGDEPTAEAPTTAPDPEAEASPTAEQ